MAIKGKPVDGANPQALPPPGLSELAWMTPWYGPVALAQTVLPFWGARAGDDLYVSGTLGDARAALEVADYGYVLEMGEIALDGVRLRISVEIGEVPFGQRAEFGSGVAAVGGRQRPGLRQAVGSRSHVSLSSIAGGAASSDAASQSSACVA